MDVSKLEIIGHQPIDPQIASLQKALRDSEALRRGVWESCLDGMVTIDRVGRIQDLNPAAERIFGIQGRDVVHRNLADVIIPASLRTSYRDDLVSLANPGDVHPGKRFEFNGLKADSTAISLELVSLPG